MDIDTSPEDDVTELAALPQSERRLVTQSYDLAVGTLMDQWREKTLILPQIQRDYVWNNAKASRLIESLLLNVPIPVLYFAEKGDKFEIIDGHQRVRSIARFVDNEFLLTSLQVLSDEDHARKRFHQLPESEQRRIKTRVIRTIIISEESHPSMKFEVFERLNTGSIALNAQEIRNSTHRGPFMDLVKDLVHQAEFREAIGTRKPRSRMADNELIIRFFALREGLSDYRPPLPHFLNRFCASANRAIETLEERREVFDKACRNTFTVLGKDAFRVTDQDLNRRDNSINRALAEAQLLALAEADPEVVRAQLHKIRLTLGKLHEDTGFLDSIQRATSDRARTLRRVRDYQKAVCEATSQG